MNKLGFQIPTSQQDFPEQVYHYTSLENAMNIVRTRSLWCSAISYLNDSAEKDFLLEAIKRRLATHKKKGRISSSLRLQNIWKGVRDMHSRTTFADEQFVGCFSKAGDSLMHWQAYCPKRGGVALGFDTRCLREISSRAPLDGGVDAFHRYFTKVGYINPADHSALDSVIGLALKTAKLSQDQADFGNPDDEVDLIERFCYTVELLACANKHQGFEVEDEFRLILFDGRTREPELRFRSVGSTLIPYYEVLVPSRTDQGVVNSSKTGGGWDALRSLVLGPSPNSKLTKRALEAFLALHNIRVPVTESGLAYRDW